MKGLYYAFENSQAILRRQFSCMHDIAKTKETREVGSHHLASSVNELLALACG